MREVNSVWYRNSVGNQFLKVAMPKDAISLQATVKTASGVHKLTIDRWGDASHKYDNYNARRHPTSRDGMAIKRYEADKMVLDPLPSPIPVLRRKKDSTRYWRTPRDEQLEDNDGERMWHSYRHPNTRRERRRSPYYPPSPQYQRQSSEEGEMEASPQPPEKVHDPQDPWRTPQYESEEDVPDLVSFNQIDGQGNPDNTPPKKLRDFIVSTEQLDQALKEATEVMKMMEKQSGTGSTPPPEALKIAKTVIDVTPNKVTPMDGPDTKIANPGRHRNKVELHKAEITEVIFLEAPGSPELEQTANVPLTPKILETSNKKNDKDERAPVISGTRKRMSPCKCSKPEACTSEATSTTAGDSGHDSEDSE